MGARHGEPLAISMDYLALALAELGNISERRLTRLTDESSNQEKLPADSREPRIPVFAAFAVRPPATLARSACGQVTDDE